jgi:hypothetical protein
MGRLPKKITTDITPRLTLKIWVWVGVGMVFVGLCAYYNISLFQPLLSFKTDTPVLEEPVDTMGQMEEATPQDLQALPIAQETAEEAIAMGDLKNDELVQIFDSQEQTISKTDPKHKAPLVMKGSVGLV